MNMFQLSMVLIKVADISNEARPLDVAEPWLDNLLQEFFKQSDAEKLEGLPVTPFMDRDKVTKPSSQVSFIGLVLMPLFEVLGELFPELQVSTTTSFLQLNRTHLTTDKFNLKITLERRIKITANILR